MKKLTMMFLGLIIAFSAGLLACEKKAEEGAEAEAAKTDEAEKPAENEGASAPEEPAEGEKLAMVDVPAEGKKFEPPVKPEQIPAGAWYCDMGTVEYARMEKGDGKCPVCGMMLKQKTEGAAANDGDTMGHEGHDHEGHDHEGHDHEGHGHEGHDHEGEGHEGHDH